MEEELKNLHERYLYVGVNSVEDQLAGNLDHTGGGNCVGLSVYLCDRLGVRTLHKSIYFMAMNPLIDVCYFPFQGRRLCCPR